jgi:catechol 2,3-dioxygenase-like lactoylglutathione lyase family enzyme
MTSRPVLGEITPFIPAGSDLAGELAFYRDALGFELVWQDGDFAGIRRDGAGFILVRNDLRAWADNASFNIAVTGLDALYEEYRDVAARLGPLEMKPWGRREFHMIVPSGVCLRFHDSRR